jgi:hypothetical protein
MTLTVGYLETELRVCRAPFEFEIIFAGLFFVMWAPLAMIWRFLAFRIDLTFRWPWPLSQSRSAYPLPGAHEFHIESRSDHPSGLLIRQ